MTFKSFSYLLPKFRIQLAKIADFRLSKSIFFVKNYLKLSLKNSHLGHTFCNIHIFWPLRIIFYWFSCHYPLITYLIQDVGKRLHLWVQRLNVRFTSRVVLDRKWWNEKNLNPQPEWRPLHQLLVQRAKKFLAFITHLLVDFAKNAMKGKIEMI